MTQEITWEKDGYIIAVTGEFDNSYLDVCLKATADERFPHINYVIVDFSDVENFPIDSDFVRKIAICDAKAYKSNSNVKLAIITGKLVLTGLVSMYKTYFELNNNDKTWPIKIFESKAKAKQWIDS